MAEKKDALDPRGLIRESYRIEGITEAECRSIFMDWALGTPVDADQAAADTNPVDGDLVPARHFGVVLDMPDWNKLAETLRAAGCEFLIEPRIRFQGEVGEQATMFLFDPSGNALEFKSFADPGQLFAT